MTSTTPLTCAALYEYDLTFRAGIAKWVADRRCPIALADYIRDLGLDAAADCADWCATEPDRPVWHPVEDQPKRDFVFPRLSFGMKYWYFCGGSSAEVTHANETPCLVRYRVKQHDSPALAILWLLDNWKPRT